MDGGRGSGSPLTRAFAGSKPLLVVSGRVRSRLGELLFFFALEDCADGHRQGMVRINFQPYTTAQLEQIVHARLGGSNKVLSKDAVKFVAMKVSSISGDARRVLDICRCVPSPHLYISTFCNGLY